MYLAEKCATIKSVDFRCRMEITDEHKMDENDAAHGNFCFVVCRMRIWKSK